MTPPRSLADDLRQRDDARLERLLRGRPDLLHPVPSDLTALATRATTGPSVSRCLDALDALHLHVLRVISEQTAEGPQSHDSLVTAAAGDLRDGNTATKAAVVDPVVACAAALDRLVDLGLVWGAPEALRSVQVVRPLVESAAPPDWPPPTMDAGTGVDDVDARAAMHARESLGLVRDLLDDWSAHPPGVLRSGGLALRDLAAARRRLHEDWPRTALTIELAHAAVLVADDGDDPPHWVPTDGYDAWLGLHTAEQWTALVRAWLELPRLASLADERTQVLSPDRDRRAVPMLRRRVLEALAAAPEGIAPSPDTIQALLEYHQPRRGGELLEQSVTATLREAEALGLTGGGALSAAARLLLAERGTTPAEQRARDREVATALRAALPEDLDHVLIQADLTVVAPGPLVAHVARAMRLLADVESRGHATVYRISEASIRRALDAGWDAASMTGMLEDISRTPVPQPLAYLIDDLARRHGTVRVGHAYGYVRCDNPETLMTILADRKLRGLGLARIADTVVVSQAPSSDLIRALRDAGYAPAAEDHEGRVVVRRPEDRRIPAPRPARVAVRRPAEDRLIAAALRSLRAGDRAHRQPRADLVSGPASGVSLAGMSSAAVVARLKSAVRDHTPVWIGYADSDGTVTQQIVDPIRVSAGVLTAFDHRTEQVRTFTVSRVTGLSSAEDAGEV